MLRRSLALIVGLVCATAAAAQEQHPLRVLYAGQPDHRRTKAFTEFLGGHFRAVGTVDFRQLSQQTADGWDVVVFDLPPDLGDKAVRDFELPAGFDRPTVLVGMWAARLAEKAKLKIDDG